jgi:hypothetical protein
MITDIDNEDRLVQQTFADSDRRGHRFENLAFHAYDGHNACAEVTLGEPPRRNKQP